MLIVLAEDDPISRTVLERTLRQWGHDVKTAVDGASAFELITTLSPNVAIVDWTMPGIDGPDLCRRVRQDPGRALTYLMLLTAKSSRADIVMGLNAGADDYLTKPFDPDYLGARLAVASRILDSTSESERLLASLSSILVGLDADGRVIRWNSMAEQTFSLSAAEVIGRPLSGCGVLWDNPSDVERIVREPGSAALHRELRFRDSRGAERLVGVTLTTMKQGLEGTPGRVVIGAEITERRHLEAHLRQAQKLEAIGQLAAGIAHEINTPMQYIGDNLRYLGDSLASLEALFGAVLEVATNHRTYSSEQLVRSCSDLARLAATADLEFLRGDLPNAVAQSLEGVDRVSGIVRAMKEFSHPGTGEKEPADLNHAIETTLIVARNELKYVADVELHLDPELPRVPCVSGEINQVLLNLFINAAHAIGDVVAASPGSRGRITVSTHTLDGAVEIRVHDTGRGIPEAVRSRIFEPFFTTKDVGKGTGQGLAMAHATIVGRHGGRVWFDSVEHQGTTFFVRLPLPAG